MFNCAALAELQALPLAASLRVTNEWHRPLLEPLLWRLREEKCEHVWQPALASASASGSFDVFVQEVTGGRPSTVFTYYLSRDGRDEPVAVAMLSPRVSKDSPEDGIPVLGRAYVRPEYRRRSVYALMLCHRLDLCRRRWGRRLLGVHIGTSSARVETVFRANFPGRTIRLGEEDLGDAGVVTALIGLTAEFDRQTNLPVPARLADEHRLLSEYLTHGADAMPVTAALPALRALAGYRDAYRLLNQFLEALPHLR
jgi:GNAT superfamily N-acetyltransferase